MASVYGSPLCQACLALPQGVSTSQAHADLRLLGQHPHLLTEPTKHSIAV